MADAACIIWTGAERKGYGRKWDPKTQKVRTVTHLVWEEAHGPIPEAQHVLHTCDTPACYNIEHLFLGTHSDNMRDRSAKGRHRSRNTDKTHCDHGHLFDEENTYLTKQGWRVCRQCKREQLRRSRKKKAA